MEVVGKAGFNEELGTVSPYPLEKNLGPKTRKSETATVSDDDEFGCDVSGNNAYFSEFELANS